jgi:plastocyanin
MRCLTAYRNRLALVFGLGLFGASSSATFAQEWADLQITFVYDGEVIPERKPVAMDKDPVCVQAYGNTKPLSEDMIVDAASKGIKNIALYPDRKKSGLEAGDIHPGLANPKAEPVTLDNNKCVFVPHVAVARKGETIKVLNSDQTAHNANFSFFNNAAVNPLIPVGAFKDILLTESETAPTPVDCNVHPWMRAYLIVSDFPYANVSDDKGVLKIEKLPANKKITFKVWHENQNKSISNVNLGGADIELPKGLFEVTLKPGMNDLGAMKIKPDQFKQ